MREMFEFLTKQEWGFWSRGILIFLVASIIIAYLLHSKLQLTLKSNLITSSIVGMLLIVMTYSVGLNCYKGYNAPKDKAMIIDFDKGIQESVLNVLNIKYEVRK